MFTFFLQDMYDQGQFCLQLVVRPRRMLSKRAHGKEEISIFQLCMLQPTRRDVRCMFDLFDLPSVTHTGTANWGVIVISWVHIIESVSNTFQPMSERKTCGLMSDLDPLADVF